MLLESQVWTKSTSSQQRKGTSEVSEHTQKGQSSSSNTAATRAVLLLKRGAGAGLCLASEGDRPRALAKGLRCCCPAAWRAFSLGAGKPGCLTPTAGWLCSGSDRGEGTRVLSPAQEEAERGEQDPRSSRLAATDTTPLGSRSCSMHRSTGCSSESSGSHSQRWGTQASVSQELQRHGFHMLVF